MLQPFGRDLAILTQYANKGVSDMAKVHDIGGWSGGKVVGVWTDLGSVIWVSEQTSGDVEFLKPSVITYIYKLTLHQGPTLTGMESTKSTPRKDK